MKTLSLVYFVFVVFVTSRQPDLNIACSDTTCSDKKDDITSWIVTAPHEPLSICLKFERPNVIRVTTDSIFCKQFGFGNCDGQSIYAVTSVNVNRMKIIYNAHTYDYICDGLIEPYAAITRCNASITALHDKGNDCHQKAYSVIQSIPRVHFVLTHENTKRLYTIPNVVYDVKDGRSFKATPLQIEMPNWEQTSPPFVKWSPRVCYGTKVSGGCSSIKYPTTFTCNARYITNGISGNSHQCRYNSKKKRCQWSGKVTTCDDELLDNQWCTGSQIDKCSDATLKGQRECEDSYVSINGDAFAQCQHVSGECRRTLTSTGNARFCSKFLTMAPTPLPTSEPTQTVIDKYDTNGDGWLNTVELYYFLEENLLPMVVMFDTNGDYNLNENELAMFLEKYPEYDGVHHKVTFTDLKTIVKENGMNESDEEIQEMIDSFETDGDGKLNENEFATFLKQYPEFDDKYLKRITVTDLFNHE